MMSGAKGLISSPFNIALAQDVPFRQPLLTAAIQNVYHGFTFVLLCNLFPFYNSV